MQAVQRKSWVARVAPERNKIFELRFTWPDGTRVWYFVRPNPGVEQELDDISASGKGFTITDYGQILLSGYGVPTEDVLQELRERYDARV